MDDVSAVPARKPSNIANETAARRDQRNDRLAEEQIRDAEESSNSEARAQAEGSRSLGTA